MFRLAVVKYITRPSFVLMRRRIVDGEIEEESRVFCDFLFGAVPVNRLAQCFKRACDRAASSSFAPNAFDIKNAWIEISAEERAARAEAEQKEKQENPVESCPNKPNHVSGSGEVKYCNPFNFNEEIVLPCRECRAKAYDDQRARFIAKHKGETVREIDTDKIGASLNLCARCGHDFHDGKCHCGCFHASISEFLQEENLTPAEIEALTREHNELIAKLVEDAETREMLLIVFDEGANCFVREKRRFQTFEVAVIRKAIEGYRQALEEK